MEHSSRKYLLRQIIEYTNLAESFGLTIEFGTDFEFFNSIPNIQSERHAINPAFNPKFTYLDERNAFWMICRDSKNVIVHTQAVKLLDLNNVSFDEYFHERVWDFRTAGFDFDPAKTTCNFTADAASITGKVAYHGELWIKGGPGGYRGGCLGIILTRLMILSALFNWSPNYLFGFQSPLTTCRGLAVREGYMRMEQRSVLWYQHSTPVPLEDWLVWMSHKEAAFNLRLSAQFFYDLFEKSAQEKTITRQLAS